MHQSENYNERLRRDSDQYLVQVQAAEDHHPVPDSYPRNQPQAGARSRTRSTARRRQFSKANRFSPVSTSDAARSSDPRIAHGCISVAAKSSSSREPRGRRCLSCLHGTAAVSVSQNGSMIRVGSLHMGDCFGEMSLLTGERRTATVGAEHDCEVIEISKPAMAAVLRDAPECRDATERTCSRPARWRRKACSRMPAKAMAEEKKAGNIGPRFSAGCALFSNCRSRQNAGAPPATRFAERPSPSHIAVATQANPSNVLPSSFRPYL